MPTGFVAHLLGSALVLMEVRWPFSLSLYFNASRKVVPGLYWVLLSATLVASRVGRIKLFTLEVSQCVTNPITSSLDKFFSSECGEQHILWGACSINGSTRPPYFRSQATTELLVMKERMPVPSNYPPSATSLFGLHWKMFMVGRLPISNMFHLCQQIRNKCRLNLPQLSQAIDHWFRNCLNAVEMRQQLFGEPSLHPSALTCWGLSGGPSSKCPRRYFSTITTMSVFGVRVYKIVLNSWSQCDFI